MDNKKISLVAGIVVLVSFVMMIVGAFMPFVKSNLFEYSYGTDTINLVNPGGQIGDGVVIVVLAVVGILLVCLKKTIAALVVSVLTAIMPFVVKNNLVSSLESQGFGDFLDKYGELGTGYSVLRFFAILLLVSAVVWFIFSKKNKQTADSQTPQNSVA
jgi:hypothetical protein